MKSYLHWNTLEKWTLAHKIGYIDHIDLIPGRWIFMDLQYLQFVPCLQTDGLTDGRWTLTDVKSLAELKALSCAKNHVCTQCRNENIWKNTWNTCNPMGDILTSCDLNIGHIDLNPCMLVDPREANKSTPEILWLPATRRFVPKFKFGKVNIQMAAVTLRNGSRSNVWYGFKVM